MLHKVLMTLITAGLLLANAGMLMALDIQETDKDNYCPAGYTLVTYDEAKANTQKLCSIMGTWDIARLEGMGSMDGPGYGCKVREHDSRDLGNSLCVQLEVVEGQGDNTCPKGYTLVTPTAARDNNGYVCSKLTEWSIARLYHGGSMDGPGYYCKVRDKDTRTLGNSVCRKTL